MLISNAFDVTADNTINAASLVQSAGTGTSTFSGNITTSAAAGVDITSNAISLGMASITAADGAARFNGATTITENLLINTTGGFANPSDGDITFTDILDAEGLTTGETLGLTAGQGTITFNNTVGATNALGALTINSAGDVTADNTIRAASLVQSAGSGTSTFNGNITTSAAAGVDITASDIVLNMSTITATNGLAIFKGPTTLTSNLSIDTTGLGTEAITFNDTLDASTTETLSLTAGAGTVTFTGAVGGALGFTQLGAMTITSAGDVTAQDTIYADSLTSAGSGTTTFNGAVTAMGTSTATGSIDVTANAIAVNALLDTTAGGLVDLDAGSGALTLALAGDIDSEDTVDLRGASIATAGDITLPLLIH
jgi:hypothetical protein